MSTSIKKLLRPLTLKEKQFAACLYCRSIYHLLEDDDCKRGLILAEDYLLGVITREELTMAFRECTNAINHAIDTYAVAANNLNTSDDYSTAITRRMTSLRSTTEAYTAVNCIIASMLSGSSSDKSLITGIQRISNAAVFAENSTTSKRKEVAEQRRVVSEIFNPGKAFRHPVAAQMAQLIRQDHDWRHVSCLGDLLQDLDCDDKEILNHCYQDREHGLGCWVIEMLLK